jgi:hypothetical protein
MRRQPADWRFETTKIQVSIKRIVDYNVKIGVKTDGSGVELTNVKMSMNPLRRNRRRGNSSEGEGRPGQGADLPIAGYG